MKISIGVVAAMLLVVGVANSGAALAGPAADATTCSFSAPKAASPAARCTAIKRQCGGKFHANYCGDKLLSAVK